jgi:hypothetical protein
MLGVAVFTGTSLLTLDDVVSEPSVLLYLGVFFVAGAASGRWLGALVVPAALFLAAIFYAALTPEPPGSYDEYGPVGRAVVAVFAFLVCVLVTGAGVGLYLTLVGTIKVWRELR